MNVYEKLEELSESEKIEVSVSFLPSGNRVICAKHCGPYDMTYCTTIRKHWSDENQIYALTTFIDSVKNKMQRAEDERKLFKHLENGDKEYKEGRYL